MNVWTLVTREADKTNLACLFGFQYGLQRSAFSKNAIGIGIANHFMELEQINSIRLQPAQRFIELGYGGSFGSAIDLGHQKGLLAITVTQRLAHANLALSAVVIPAVVEKIDAFVNPCPDNADALFDVTLSGKVVATKPD